MPTYTDLSAKAPSKTSVGKFLFLLAAAAAVASVTAFFQVRVDDHKGPVGPKGATGLRGLAGLNGTAGVAGTNGSAGATGATGAAGATGATGAAGVNGTDGADGATGAAGAAGAAGVDAGAFANISFGGTVSYPFTPGTNAMFAMDTTGLEAGSTLRMVCAMTDTTSGSGSDMVYTLQTLDSGSVARNITSFITPIPSGLAETHTITADATWLGAGGGYYGQITSVSSSAVTYSTAFNADVPDGAITVQLISGENGGILVPEFCMYMQNYKYT